MSTKLIKAKISLTTEIVVENHYMENNVQAARSAFLTHHDEIIAQALRDNEVVITAMNIKNSDDLPANWTPECLPWLPGIAYGDSKQIRKIKDFFKKEES